MQTNHYQLHKNLTLWLTSKVNEIMEVYKNSLTREMYWESGSVLNREVFEFWCLFIET
jgi:hypothetical protein